ncbi:MAG TPA: glycoside hydrolase family 65 protein [Actinobacteria bacterium]|nr:glycoside hydrolase family 65 protein [Actinomycetota bacterium]
MGADIVVTDGVRLSDSLQAICEQLAARGVGWGLLLVAGARLPAPAGRSGATVLPGVPEPPALCRLLDEQLRRRMRGRVPSVDEDPAWTLQETGWDPLRHRVIEAMFTLGSGGFATRGAAEEARPGSVPMVLASGIYTDGSAGEHLLPGPDWTGLDIAPAPECDRHVLDLRTGVLLREEKTAEHPVRTVRFASVTRPGVVAMRAEAAAGRVRPGRTLRQPKNVHMIEGSLDGHQWAQVPGSSGVTAVAAQRLRRDGGVATIERLVAFASGKHGPPAPGEVAAALEAAERQGFERLLAEHRAAWAGRWAAVNVDLPDDPETQLAVRFALFQLWCNVGGSDEAAVGARGLSGDGYAGHVFWDADVFVLPAIASMDPATAKAMANYRSHRLPAARAAARAAGYRGARFPWESASLGNDVTPASGYLGGRPVEIKTGQLEEHITADVAWAAWHCAQWTGDRWFVRGRHRLLLLETARYWASRCRLDSDGRAHIDEVIGPDEYHESVSDNAFTNVMARWNLRTAARLLSGSAAAGDEARQWTDVASSLVDGYRSATGLYEQFTGYFGLEPLTVADITNAPVAADVLLGPERIAATQVIKQPDVLMLHHLVPDEVAPGSLAPNLGFYGPRTAHGSSLSPAISASLMARAGHADDALRLLRTALRLDLDDLTGTTAAGVHLATMGGVWQALLFGFAGIRVRAGVLHLDPNLPGSWRSLGLRFRCLGRYVRLHITADHVRVGVDAPLRVCLDGHRTRLVTGAARLPRDVRPAEGEWGCGRYLQ